MVSRLVAGVVHGGESSTQPAARPMQADRGRARGAPQHGGEIGGCELLPGDQPQELAVVRRQGIESLSDTGAAVAVGSGVGRQQVRLGGKPVRGQIMAWMMDTYSMNTGTTATGVVTGKPLHLGGSSPRDCERFGGDVTGGGLVRAPTGVGQHLPVVPLVERHKGPLALARCLRHDPSCPDDGHHYSPGRTRISTTRTANASRHQTHKTGAARLLPTTGLVTPRAAAPPAWSTLSLDDPLSRTAQVKGGATPDVSQ